MIEPTQSPDKDAPPDDALAGRIAATLVREGLRPALATRLAYALLPVVTRVIPTKGDR